MGAIKKEDMELRVRAAKARLIGKKRAVGRMGMAKLRKLSLRGRSGAKKVLKDARGRNLSKPFEYEVGGEKMVFLPSVKHWEFIDAMAGAMLGGKPIVKVSSGELNAAAIARYSSYSRDTMMALVRELREDVGFNLWFQSQWQGLMKNMKPHLDIVGIQNSRKHFNYWEAMQKMYGGYVPETREKKEIDIKGVIMLPERQIFDVGDVGEVGEAGDSI